MGVGWLMTRVADLNWPCRNAQGEAPVILVDMPKALGGVVTLTVRDRMNVVVVTLTRAEWLRFLAAAVAASA